ncbi:MAG: hypothetical protein US62_C0015G0024 [Candidatus Woesebacteria bacterium GW2011_GWA1_37_8]|uniref:SCP domain-containing protein n=2 Tax=Candidatus Woeseibacteriota TaxID=1752722 RepID=A0A0G0HQL2_9BACT|nr:MAG: hypothetical protein US39_C0005G0033 [Microgenomates group bacterium GW2011_GWC1_37_12b]KKQ45443.1 MAG: hypothetical protein US62_C0015G0024 [Candidatus Woesebacteria bacterium GW2011_GWA1_37_8]
MFKAFDLAVHYFYPGSSNDHKAKALHADSIFAIASLLLAFQLLLRSFPAIGIRILGYASNIPPEKIIELTNKKRADAGLPALTYNPTLAIAAKAKGENMLANDYWAHTAPDGTEPWAFFATAGYKYKYAGENLARDFSNPESAIEAWMASNSHKENILSTRYKEIGVAVVEGDLAGSDTTIIVQLFGAPSGTSDQVPVAKAFTQSTPTPAPTRPPALALVTTIVPTGTEVPTETALPSPILTPTPSTIKVGGGMVTEAAPENRSPLGILVSPFDTTRTVSLLTIIFLSVIMIIDAVVVYKKKIPRLSGRTAAHLAFLGTILLMAILSQVGKIL